jgi:hypothetical protein
MTVDPNSIDLPAFMAEHLQRAEPDAICGAGYGEPQPGADQLPQRLSDPRLRHPHREHGGRGPQAA